MPSSPCPVPPPLCLPVSVLVFTLSSCATVVAVVVIGVVRFASILSPFPRRGHGEGEPPCLCPHQPAKGTVPVPRWTGGGAGEGRDLESSVCTCGGHRVCVPTLRSPRSPSHRTSVDSGSVATDRVPPSLSPPPCPEPLLETPQAASAQDKSVEDVRVEVPLAGRYQNFKSASESLAP